jgi:hypothetical protein
MSAVQSKAIPMHDFSLGGVSSTFFLVQNTNAG